MKPKHRIINYVVLFLLYFFGTVLILQIPGLYYVILKVGIGYFLINSINAFVIIKLNFYLNILLAIVITVISLFLALHIGRLEPFPDFDPYGILTTVISNALISIVFWEMVYRIKVKYKVN